MLNIVNGIIQLTRGDTARLTVDVVNREGETYTPNPSDTLTLTVKKTVYDAEPVFQKVLEDENTFIINPSDTEKMTFKKYVYDVQLTMANGDVYTIIEPHPFEILSEVTY